MSIPNATPRPSTKGSALMNTKLSESSALHGCAPEPAWPSTATTPNAVSAKPATTSSQVTILTCAPVLCLRLALSRTALEGLERAQLVPRLLVRLGCGKAEPPRVGLDHTLADADINRAALHARWSALTPEAQIALRERVRAGVVRDARSLWLGLSLVGRERHVARGKDARLIATAARHARVFLDEARAGLRLDLQRIHRADVEALGGGALKPRLLMKGSPVRIRGLHPRVDLDGLTVADPDARRVGETHALVLLRADDLAGEATDAQRRVGEDHATRELRRLRRRRARDGRAADRLASDERDDRCRAPQEVPTRYVRPVSLCV